MFILRQIYIHSSAVKLLKLVNTPLNVSFLKTVVVILSFSAEILTSKKKGSYLFQFQRNIDVYLFFVQIVNKR